MTTLRIGSRGSALARIQADLVVSALAARGVAADVVIIETAGDRRAPDTAWGEGAFVTAIAQALLEGRIDLAVHSTKDLPTRMDAGLRLVAFLPRADARDALVLPAARGVAPGSVAIEDLPLGVRVGTDSPRRGAFLRAVRPDLVIVPLHGNVDTRLRRLDSGEVDALVLAVAGLERLGRADRIGVVLDPAVCPPAPGQGAIAVQARADDRPTQALVASLDDPDTRLAVETERSFLAAMGGGCRSPIGAFASVEPAGLRLRGGVATPDGGWTALATDDGPRDAGTEVAARLAAQLRAAAHRRPGPRRVLVTRPAGQADGLVAALAREGVHAAAVPAVAIETVAAGGPLDAAAADLARHDHVVVTSANGARAIGDAVARTGVASGGVRWAAVGAATAAVLHDSGIGPVWVPQRSSGAAIAVELPIAAGDRVLLPRGDQADGRLPDLLRARGAHVTEVVAYRTLEAPDASRPAMAEALLAGDLDAVLFSSGSAVQGAIALAGDHADDLLALPAICLGPETAAVAAAHGLRVLAHAPMQSDAALAALTARALRSTTDDPPSGDRA